jgi:prenyltransferase beta subunit
VRHSTVRSSIRPWRPDSLPVEFEPGFARLRDRVVARVDAFGAVRSPCQSRVLESVIAMRLLSRVGIEDGKLRGHLEHARSGASPLDVATVDIALHGSASIPDAARDELVARSPDFTGARKQAFFDAYLALCGVGPGTTPPPQAFSLQGLHSWAAVQMTSAKVVLATADAPADVLDRIAGHLLAQQQPGGGWSYTDASRQTDVDDTSVAVQFLHMLDPAAHKAAIRRGVQSLYAVRGGDGGFPTYVPGAPSEACMTAAAVDALTTDWHQHGPAIAEGLDYLAAHQLPDGSFAPDWSASRFHTVFRVLLACARNSGHRPEHVSGMADRALKLVRGQQNRDGGWGQQAGDVSDPVSTAYAIIALCGQDDPAPVSRGVAYLLSHQQPDGGISSTSDSIGPRPFIFTVPALADIFPLLALGHVARRVEHARRPATVAAS